MRGPMRGMAAMRDHTGRSAQRGAVLLVALVILVVLTLLGVSTMNSTQLEEKMAANNQEVTRAFHAAESGLSEAFNDNAAWTVSQSDPIEYDAPETDGIISPGKADTSSTFLGFSPPPPGSLYSATSFQSANFDFQSDSCTDQAVTDDSDDGIVDDCVAADALTVTVHGGAYQIAPKNN